MRNLYAYEYKTGDLRDGFIAMGARSNVVILSNKFGNKSIYCPCCGKDIKDIEEDGDNPDDIWDAGTFTVKDSCLFGIVDLRYHCERFFCNHCDSEFVEFEKMSSIDRNTIKSILFFIINLVLIYVSVRYLINAHYTEYDVLPCTGAFLWSCALLISFVAIIVRVSKYCSWHLFPGNIHKRIYQNHK